MSETNNFDIWEGDAPFVANGDGDFELWEGNSPYLDMEQSQAPTTVRRRSFVIAQTSS